MWNIKPELNKEETIAELKARLEALPKTIGELKKCELGVGFNQKDSRHDIVLYTELESREDLQVYLLHPDHKEVGKYVRSVVCDRVDVDYEI